MVDHRALIDRLVQTLNRHDWERLREVYAPDAVIEYPQSGERFRGIDNIIGHLANYPGGLVEGGTAIEEVVSGATYGMTPMFTIVLVEGSATRGTGIFHSTYPDGSRWWVLNVFELEGELIGRARIYFAPEFEPPEWRAPYRES